MSMGHSWFVSMGHSLRRSANGLIPYDHFLLEGNHWIDFDLLLVDVLDETPLNEFIEVTVDVVSFHIGSFTQRRFGHPTKIFPVGK